MEFILGDPEIKMSFRVIAILITFAALFLYSCASDCCSNYLRGLFSLLMCFRLLF